MQDRRNHWRETSLPQKRFANPESFTSYQADPNELPLTSEQERVITLLPTPYASPSASSISSCVWEPTENQSFPNRDNLRRYDDSMEADFHRDSTNVGWNSANFTPLQTVPFNHHQHEQSSHQFSVQDHDLRQRWEPHDYHPPPWKTRNSFDNQDGYDSHRYGRNGDASLPSYPGTAQHPPDCTWNETHSCENTRYQNHRAVERGPDEQYVHVENTAEDMQRHYGHFETYDDGHSHPSHTSERDYHDRTGNNMRAAVPLFPDDHRYIPDPPSVNKTVLPYPSLQRGHNRMHDQRISRHRADFECNRDESITIQPVGDQTEVAVLKSHRTIRNRVPLQDLHSPNDHTYLQAGPGFRKHSDSGSNDSQQQHLPERSDCTPAQSNRAAVMTMRNMTAPLEVEEGELVDDSDDEGALVIDESEEHDREKNCLNEKTWTSESQSRQLSPPTRINRPISLDISHRIESEIQQAKEASSRTQKERDSCQTSDGQTHGKDGTAMMYPMGEPELLASEILKQPNFVKQLCVHTGQKFSSFSLLWQAVERVECILKSIVDQCDVKAFQNFVSEKMPKCYLNSKLISSDSVDQRMLYKKEIEFFDQHYHGNVSLWKKNVLQYYRRIVQFPRSPSLNTSSNNCTPLLSSQALESEQNPSFLSATNSPVPDQQLTEHPASIHIEVTAGDLLTASAQLPAFTEVQCYNNQPSIVQRDQVVCELQNAAVGVCSKESAFVNEHGSITVEHHGMGMSSERREDAGSHHEVQYNNCEPFAGPLENTQQILNPVTLHSELSPRPPHPIQSEHQQLTENAVPPPTTSHSGRTEPMQMDKQYKHFQPVSSHRAFGFSSNHASQQHYSSSCSPSDSFMSLHVTSDDRSIFNSNASQSGTLQMQGHHNIRSQHVFGDENMPSDYSGRDLHLRSEGGSTYCPRVPDASTDDQPYDPELPLPSLQGSSPSSHYSQRPIRRTRPHHHHASLPPRRRRSLKDSGHFYATRPLESKAQTFAHSNGGGANLGHGRKPQYDFVEPRLRPYEGKGVGKGIVHTRFSGPSNKQRKKWSSKRRRKYLQGQKVRAGVFASSDNGYGASVQGGEEHTARSYGERASAMDSRQRKHHTPPKHDYSDEDLEVLQLRKEAIMSIVNNNAEKAHTMKRTMHRPTCEEAVDLQDKKPVSNPRDSKHPPSVLQAEAMLVEKENKVQTTASEVEVLTSSVALVITQPVVQQQQKDNVTDVSSIPSPSSIGNSDRLLRSTPVRNKGEDSPVPSPLVAALKKNEQRSKSRSASPLLKLKPNNTAIKVVPRDSQTHKVQDFSIQINNSSESSESEIDTSEPSMPIGQRPSGVPTSEDINQLVKVLRKDSENEQKVLASQQTGTVKLLPPGQQVEYNELKLKLALYKKRNRKGPQMGTKAKTKTAHLHLKRGSAPAVMVSKQLKAKPTPLLKVADVFEIKNRIEMCNSLIKNNKSSIDNEITAQNELLKQQTTLEQELDESNMRIELLEKKLKDAREEHKKFEAAVAEIRSKVASSKETVANHTSCIKEKDNEIRLLQRKLRLTQQQSNLPQSDTKSDQSVKDIAMQPTSLVVANSFGEDQSLLDKMVITSHNCEITSPNYPQYESVSDAEDTCASDLLDTVSRGVMNSQLSSGDVNAKENALSPLETEMISDSETADFTLVQIGSTANGPPAPGIMVEMVSDSEDTAEQSGKDGMDNLQSTKTKSTINGQEIEQVSDTEEWCGMHGVEDNGAKSAMDSLKISLTSLIGSTLCLDQSAQVTLSGINQNTLVESSSSDTVRRSPMIMVASSDVDQNSPVVTKSSSITESVCTTIDNCSEKSYPLQHALPSSSSPSVSISEQLEPSLTVNKLPEAESKQLLNSQQTSTSTNSSSIVSLNAAGIGSIHPAKNTKAAKESSPQCSSATAVSKHQQPSRNSSQSFKAPATHIPPKTRQDSRPASSIPLKGGRAAGNTIATKTLPSSSQLKSTSASQIVSGPNGNKIFPAKNLSTQNFAALHKMRTSTTSAMSQRLMHKANPKRLVHSKAADLHGRLKKELLALEALKTARKVKSSKELVQGAHTALQKSGVASPITDQCAEISEQLKQVTRLLGLPAREFKLPSRSDMDMTTLLTLSGVAASSVLPATCNSLWLTTTNSSTSPRFIPEQVILGAEKLERQRCHQRDAMNKASLVPSTGYISPLLAFRSYRLSPHFTKFASLTSLTYSNKIDPLRMMCRFELLGNCNDPDCPAQHFKDIKLSKEEMARDLVSYCPALAGCSEDVSFVDDSLPENQQKISIKLDSYAKSLCDSFSAKLSDEQLYLYIAHKVTLGRKEATGSSGIDLDEHAWCPKPKQQAKSLKEAPQLSDAFPCDMSKDLGVDMGTDNSPGQRYYSTEVAVMDLQDPCDPAGWVKKAQRAGSFTDAHDVLKQGLLVFPSSEELWVHFLQTVCNCKDSVEHQNSTQELWSKAVETCPTYSVLFECVREASTYDLKRGLLADGIKILVAKCYSSMEEKSHNCLELLLNAVLLEQMCGAHEQALKIMQQALFAERDETSCSAWIGIKSHLVKEDFIFAVLCFGHFTYHACLPLTLLFGYDACPPARLVNKELFVIQLNQGPDYGAERHEQIVQLFHDLLVESLAEDPSDTTHKFCNVLCQNIVQLEAACGNLCKVQAQVTELLASFPSADDIWLLLAKLNEQDSIQKSIDTLSEAAVHCPQSPEIYYCAASLLDALGQSNEAAHWLKKCVMHFYEISETTDVSTTDCFVLYRKLLGQLIPYQCSVPPFSASFDVKKLGLNFVSLWKCYILLMKLSHPTTSREFYHSNAEDAFESAVHSVHDQLRLKLLWWEYLTHLRMQALNNPTIHNFKLLSDCVERCIEAVKYQQTFPYILIGQPSEYRDYAFHNEVLGLFLDCFPVNSNSRLFFVTKYLKMLPRNAALVSRLVQCGLNQSPEEIELAQVVLANYLAEDPACCFLWKMAISLELKLGHTREARWMYRQATMALPLQADLWKEFLLFELHELQYSRSSPAIISWLVERCNQVGLDLIPFAKKTISHF